MKSLFFLFFILLSNFLFAQNDSSKNLTFSGYGEVYYSYDFDSPQNHEKPIFLYNHKRHNEVAINLLLAKASYLNQNIRGNIGLMMGTYTQYNLSAEPMWAQFIYEANVGVKLSKKNNIWLDAGIMPSHIGFESAISADCWTLTRSMLAENSPYYEAGLKFSYTSKNEKLFLNLLYLNGWQRIRKPNDIQNPSFGMQFTYKPLSKLTFNYSNFIGTDKPDDMKSMRQYHNLFLQCEPNSRFGFIAGFDIGSEKILNKKYDFWYSPVLIIRHSVNEKTKIALRGEYFLDEKEKMISYGLPNGFQTLGISSNIDYLINEKILFRVEGKMYQSKDKIFDDFKQQNNFAFTTSLSLKL